MWLAEPRIAQVAVDALKFVNDQGKYELFAYAFMPNHAHVLIKPSPNLPSIMRWLKGRTTRIANRMLHRSKENFWQDESYDHIIRSSLEFEQTLHYIENNSVKADYGEFLKLWRFSSAWRASSQATQGDVLCRGGDNGD